MRLFLTRQRVVRRKAEGSVPKQKPKVSDQPPQAEFTVLSAEVVRGQCLVN
jgi:hypothetical protein